MCCLQLMCGIYFFLTSKQNIIRKRKRRNPSTTCFDTPIIWGPPEGPYLWSAV
jgi:hypothetical protein